jgi:hypothetical protein
MLKPPFRALLVSVTLPGGYSDAMSLRAVLVQEVDEPKGRALCVFRCGTRFYKKWQKLSELLLEPGSFREMCMPIAAAVLVRAPSPLLYASSIEDAEAIINQTPPSS